MNAKHMPSTPLPWKLSGDPQWGISARAEYVAQAQQVTSGPAGFDSRRIGNAAYIVHAANAYPRLVEEVKELRRWVGLLPAALIGGSIVPERIDALLRELGEA